MNLKRHLGSKNRLFALILLVVISSMANASSIKLALGRSGCIYKLETELNRVIKTDRSGIQQAGYGGSGLLLSPQGIASDNNSNVFISDTGNNRVVQLIDRGGAFELIKVLKNPAPSWGPTSLRVGKTGDLYITDTQNKKIWRHRPDDTYSELPLSDSKIYAFNSSSQPDRTYRAYGIAVDRSGSTYVANTSQNSIQKYSSENRLIMDFGVRGSGRVKFINPRDVAVDPNGYIYVADTGNNRIQKLDNSGKFRAFYGADLRGKGSIFQPSNVLVEDDGYLYVTTGKGEVIKYDIAVRFNNLKADNRAISPNGDGIKDTLTVKFTVDSDSRLNCVVYKQGDNDPVRTLADKLLTKAGNAEILWDGKDNDGNLAGDGGYSLMLQAYTSDGKKESFPREVKVALDNSPPEILLKAEPAVISPGKY